MNERAGASLQSNNLNCAPLMIAPITAAISSRVVAVMRLALLSPQRLAWWKCNCTTGGHPGRQQHNDRDRNRNQQCGTHGKAECDRKETGESPGDQQRERQ